MANTAKTLRPERPSLGQRLALLMIIALFSAAPNGHAIIRTWSGGDGNWSDGSHWSPSGPPQNGDDLVFENSSRSTMNNDLAGLTVRTLEFHHSGQIVGTNSLTVTVGISKFSQDDGPLAMNFSSLDLGADISIDVNDGTGWGYTLNCLTRLNGHTLTCYAHNFGASTFYEVIEGPGRVVFASGTNYVISHGGTTSVPIRVTSGYLGLSGTMLGGSPAIGGPLEIDSGATVFLTGDSAIADTDTVTIVGGGQLSLEGHTVAIGSLVISNYSGDTIPCTVDASGAGLLGINGSITSWNDSFDIVPIIRGRVSLNGFRSIFTGGSAYAGLDLPAALGGGFGGFSKAGNSALLLRGPNTFSGGVEVDQGILDVNHVNALGAASGGVLLNGGSLSLRTSIFGETLTASGGQQITPETSGSLLTVLGTTPLTWSGPVVLNTNLVVVGGDITISGQISGPGGIDFRTTGTAQLAGSSGNSYSGTTLVRCSLLELNKPSGVNAYAGPLVVGGASGGTCEVRWLNSYQNVGATVTLYANGLLNLNNFTEDFGPVTFNGGEVDTGTGTFNIYAPLTVNPNPNSAVINGYLGLPPGDNRVFIVGDGASDCDLLVNAVVFGSPGLYVVKQGAGTMCLANVNTFDAPTLLEEGILDINNSFGLGTWPGLVIFDGATLRLSGTGTGRGFEGIGAGVGGTHGAIEVLPNCSWTLAGGVLLDGPITFNIGTSSELGFSGAISSSGPGCSVIKTGAGTLYFNGAANNTYSGDTIISSGSFNLNKNPNVAAVPGNLIIGPGPAGPATIARLLQVGGLWGTTVTVNANALFDLNGYSMSLPQLNLRDGGNVLTSGGTLSFPSGGTINVGSQSASGSEVASTILGFVSLPLNGAVTFNVSPRAPTTPSRGVELEVTAVISGALNRGSGGALIKEGLGQLRLSGNNTFAGSVGVNAGTLIAAHANALGSTNRGTAVNNGAQLILEGGINIAGESITLNSTNVPALESRDGLNTSGGILYLNRNSVIGPSFLADGLAINGQIDGPGALTKVGLGTLTLGGSVGNTYAGETFVNGGTLLLNKTIAVNAIPNVLEIGGVDEISSGTVRNLNGYQIFGNIYVHSHGLYDVNGQEENTDALYMYGNGAVQTSGGSLYLKPGAPLFVYPGSNTTSTIFGNLVIYPGNHVFTVGGGATLPAVQDLLINAVISETSPGGAIQKEGAGRIRLMGDNSYSGGTTINAGTLQVDGSIGQGTVTVNAGKLQGVGTVGSVSLSSASAVVAPGDSPGILNCGSIGGGSGTLQVELNGTTPGPGGYDQLNVSGSVNLSGMSLNASLGYASSASDQFIIINNDGTDPVIGTFTGLPQGTNFYVGGQLFYIDYTGGTGNDVVLRRLVTPPKPALIIERVPPASVRLLWPTNDPAYWLQYNTNLTATDWATVTTGPVLVGSNYVVTNAIAGQTKFYRLIK